MRHAADHSPETYPGGVDSAVIAQHPGANLRQLLLRLCEAWGWRKANGVLRDMVCRGLLLELEWTGGLELPPASHVHRNPPVRHPRHGTKALAPFLLDTTPLEVPLRALRPLEFQLVRRTPEEPLSDHLVAQYHPLGYVRPVGEHLEYLVYAMARPIACLAWSSAARHLGARDRYIGWSAEARWRNIRFLAYNPRYLIVAYVRVKHLASHILGEMARRISSEWERAYGHPVPAGKLARHLSLRGRDPGAGSGARGAAALPPGAQPAGDGCPPRAVRGPVRGKESGAQLGARRGHHLWLETLDSAHAVPPPSGGAAGLEHRGAGPEEMHFASSLSFLDFARHPPDT